MDEDGSRPSCIINSDAPLGTEWVVLADASDSAYKRGYAFPFITSCLVFAVTKFSQVV